MTPRMPWEAQSAELLNPLNCVNSAPIDRESRAQPRSARSAVQQTQQREELVQDAIRRFNAGVSILEMLERHLGQGALRRVASTNGGEWAGPCPLCGGQDRFRVWPTPREGKPGAWCRQCEISGDALAWAVRFARRDPRTPRAAVETLRDFGFM